MRRVRTLLVRTRPRFWLYLAGPALVGAVYGASAITELAALPIVLLLGYFLLPANAFLYGINDIADARVDRHNPKKETRERRFEGDRWTVLLTIAGAGLGLAILPFLPLSASPWVLGFLVLGGAYSARPIRLKTKPPFDSLSNGLYILPAGATYVSLAGTSPPVLAVVGGWLWAMAMHTFSAIPDIQPDRQAGIDTTATVLGKKGSVLYCGGCWLLAAIAFGLLDPRAGLLLGVYPVILTIIAGMQVGISRAYWWFPMINAVVGMVLTLGGLWRLVYG